MGKFTIVLPEGLTEAEKLDIARECLKRLGFDDIELVPVNADGETEH